MTHVLCAYETNLPGFAEEKLTQRADLESMLNQLEEEGLQKATTEMPQRHANNSAGSASSCFLNHTKRSSPQCRDLYKSTNFTNNKT